MEEPDEDSLEYKLFVDGQGGSIDQNHVSEQKIKYENKRLLMRHRLDLAKLLLGKDGGYSLRKFKRIYKREMEENPHKYTLLN